jgi:putative membrane protein
MKRAPLLTGLAILAVSWTIAAAGAGMTGHMTAHMAAVAIAAPLIAYAVAGSDWDPAVRWPRLVGPLQMSVVELFVVWGWHLPAARNLASSSIVGLVLEQAMFLGAGLLLWSACLGAREAESATRRMVGVGALLLTTMHMTLLGALVALAPRPLFDQLGFTCLGVEFSPLSDQQLGGVVMLLVGACIYLLGGLVLLSRELRDNPKGAAWS